MQKGAGDAWIGPSWDAHGTLGLGKVGPRSQWHPSSAHSIPGARATQGRSEEPSQASALTHTPALTPRLHPPGARALSHNLVVNKITTHHSEAWLFWELRCFVNEFYTGKTILCPPVTSDEVLVSEFVPGDSLRVADKTFRIIEFCSVLKVSLSKKGQ